MRTRNTRTKTALITPKKQMRIQREIDFEIILENNGFFITGLVALMVALV